MVEPQKYLKKEKIISMGQSCVCYNLRKASRSITRLYDEFLKPSGILATQLTILLGTKILQPVTLKKLSKASMMDRTTLSRNLKPLEKNRLVGVEPGQDRRERIITRPLKNANFCLSSRKAKILTAGIHLVFRG